MRNGWRRGCAWSERAGCAAGRRSVIHTGALVDTLEIRPARPADAPQILDLQRSAYRIEAERYGDFTLPPLTETLDDLAVLFATHTILVARHTAAVAAVPSDPVVGSVRARVVGDTAHVARLAVRPALHGRGIGRRLLLAIERAVAPVERYELFTGHRSDRNLRMYERAGYRRLQTVRESDRVSLTYFEKVVARDGVAVR
jgi:ribosomal protein S18 acetylase RimI-like enzyme